MATQTTYRGVEVASHWLPARTCISLHILVCSSKPLCLTGSIEGVVQHMQREDDGHLTVEDGGILPLRTIPMGQVIDPVDVVAAEIDIRATYRTTGDRSLYSGP